MAEERGVIKYEAKDGQQVTLTFDTIRKYLVNGRSEFVTPQEMMFFMGACKSRGLNPFNKDCYLIKYSQNEGAAIITSVDYFRKRARAQKDCRGWQKGIIIERNGEIVYSKGLMLEGDKLLGGWFRAQPAGWTEPFELEVNLKAYIKRKKDGSVTKFWSKENQPSQIAKVAESQGLRTLWPDEFQQLYTQEEVGSDNQTQDIPNITAEAEGANEPTKPVKYEAENISQSSEQQKTTGKAGEDAPISRKDFINLKEAGFSTWFYKNKAKIEAASDEIKDEVQQKWGRTYPESPYPLAPKPANNEPPISDFPDQIPCPEKDGGDVPTSACDVCKMRKGCPSWEELDGMEYEEKL